MGIELTDNEPAVSDDAKEILSGFRSEPKTIPPKYFYDERGSRLFDRICEQPEYYPTRTELGIMEKHAAEMAKMAGPEASLIEFGSGSSLKTRLLLGNLERPAVYVPVDISREHLVRTAGELDDEFPNLEVLPVCADFTQPFDLPDPAIEPRRNLVYFPGSTIGNFSRDEALSLLRVMRETAKDDGALLIGVDLIKDPEILEPAYNDAAGVTADFNLNLLKRLNREHDADFELDAFRHRAVFDAGHGRIEMRLISLAHQRVRVAGRSFDMAEGEYIVTEHSHKYSIEDFEKMAGDAGFALRKVWTDTHKLFSVQYYVTA